MGRTLNENLTPETLSKHNPSGIVSIFTVKAFKDQTSTSENTLNIIFVLLRPSNANGHLLLKF